MNEATLNIVIKAKDQASAAIKGATQAINDNAKQIAKFGQQATAAGKTLTKDLTLPIVGIGAAVFKVSGDFEDSLNKIVGLVGISRDQVNAWAKDIEKLGPSLGKSPQELGDAMFYITSAGLRGAKALDALTYSAKASAAGLGDTATVADAVTSAMNAYSKQGLTAGNATDVLTAAVRAGKLEASSLAPVLGTLLPTASAMNIRFADVAGTLAVMSRTGLDAATAATSINAVMTALLKPGKMAKDTLASVGLNMQDLRDTAAKPGGLIEVMRILDAKFGDNDEALTQIVPNVRAFRGVMNVLAQDGNVVNDVMGQVANSTGITDEAFNAAAQGGAFKLRQAMAQSKVTLIEIGTTVMPVLSRVLDNVSKALKGVADWFEKLSPTGQKVVLTITGILAAAGPLLIIVGKMATGISAIIRLFSLFSAGAAVAGGETTALAGTVGVASAAFLPWIVGIAAVTVGIGFLVKKIIDHNKNNDELKRSVDNTAKSIHPYSDAINTAADSTKTLTQNLKDNIREISFSSIFTTQQKNTQDDLNMVKEKYAELQKQQPALDDAVRRAQADVATAQADYNDKVTKYGQYSDEATAAADRLSAKQDALSGTLRVAAGNVLNLSNAKSALKDANNDLTDATQTLNTWQGILKDGIDKTVTTIAKFGPTSLAQIPAVAQLHDSIKSVTSLSGDLGQLTASVINISNLLGSSSSTANKLQGTVNAIKIQAGSLGTQLQGTSVQVQGARAGGGDVSAGSTYLVGEKGPELFTAPSNGTVIPNDKTEKMVGSTISIVNNNSFARATDPIAFARQQAFELSRR